jgi:nitroreductase
MDVEQAIRTRRSHKVFGGRAIDAATLRELIELAIWAPNHKRTEPWRFAVVHGEKLRDLASASAALLTASARGPLDAKLQAKIDKTSEMLQTAGAVIAVSCVRSPGDPVRDREDYAACACAIQNLMLGATARGLVSYWTTGAALIHPDLHGFWHTGEGEEIIGAIVLGNQAVEMPALRYKSVDDVTRWL